ncbi:paired amphipathic helix protein Sin3b [Nematocida major]|uniref:paired amphipathic helix protein Sin3b n=1 Tax=Nematocida major TaxID=1912982 RepID=UPI002007C477|nr:paired amphipathic helix protein Sin3b [Nematocida major]KAH9385769.1 paired amphipathic helix protein Sin3b [Nematocida major]
MEDQKKTDVIKNMRTVLPSLNLKESEVPEQPAQKSPSPHSAHSPQEKHPRATQEGHPRASQEGHPRGPDGHMGGMPPQAPYGYRPMPERHLDRHPDRPMHMPNGRYRVHPSSGYMPYNPYGKAPMGYPPCRQPAHAQTRYFPPSRQHPYMGEMHHGRVPSEKKPSVTPPPRHAPTAILMPEVGGSAKVQIKDAMRYLDVVKEEYKNNKEVYNKFLKTMKDYKDRHIDAKTVIEIMLALFNGNQKLIQGFNQFLPKKYEILPSGEVKVHEHAGQSVGSPGPVPGMAMKSKPSSSAGSPIGLREDARRDDPRRDLEGLGIGIKNGRSELDSTSRVVNYLNKVRKHLEGNPVAWFEFLRIVQSYKNSRDQKPVSEILASIKVLLRDDPVLISEFMVFLPGQERRGRAGTAAGSAQASSLSMLHDIRTILTRKGVYREFVRALNLFNQGLISTSALLLVVEPFLRGSTICSLFRYYIGHREAHAPPHIQSSLETYEKVGSYRVLPEKYRHSTHSGQSADDASVLNTGYVSCPTFSSESSTFIFAKKNVHEETLFRIEDERYECDLLLERVSSLILRLVEYENAAAHEANCTREGAPVALKPLSLSALDREVISAVYGSACDDLILGLIAHPLRAIPVVLKQMRAAETTWIRARASSAEGWAQATDRNFIKALDVRGFKARSTERKALLIRQYARDLDTENIRFVLTKELVSEVFSIICTGMDLDGCDLERTRTLRRFISQPGVFVCSNDAYCAIRGVSLICARVSSAVSSEHTKPKPNGVAADLGLVKDDPTSTVSSLQDVMSLIRAHVLGDLECAEFEETVIKSLGVAGAQLAGILSLFQSVSAMIETAVEGTSAETLDRLANRKTVQKTNLTELLLRGVSLVRVELNEEENGALAVQASRVVAGESGSAEWAKHVKDFSRSSEAGNAPFLRRTLRTGGGTACFGMESFFVGGKCRLKHMPGTEDFVLSKDVQK